LRQRRFPARGEIGILLQGVLAHLADEMRNLAIGPIAEVGDADEGASKRMIKKQQMRWNKWTVQPFLNVRVAVLDKTLAGSLERLYPDFQPADENHAKQLAA
jgi:hypothetical protein